MLESAFNCLRFGWIYRRETTMLLCSALRIRVKASTPDSLSLLTIVWRREGSTKSASKSACRFASIFSGGGSFDPVELGDIRLKETSGHSFGQPTI